MPFPFPGMNPYLEHPDRWSTVHNRLIVAIAVLTPQLLPRSFYPAAFTPKLICYHEENRCHFHKVEWIVTTEFWSVALALSGSNFKEQDLE